MIEDIPFDGDANEPLPEELLKARQQPVAYTEEMLESEEYQLVDSDALIARFLCFGAPKEDLVEKALQEELNTVKLEVEIAAIRKRADEKKRHIEEIRNAYAEVDALIWTLMPEELKVAHKHFALSADLTHFKRIFSVLGANGLSVNQFAEVIEPCDWLTKAYIKQANTGVVRQALDAVNAGEAEDIKQAINILSVNVATRLLPELIITHSARLQTGVATDMWRMLLKYQKLTTLAAYKLAVAAGMNPEPISVATAISMFAEMALLNLYCKEAKKAKLKALENARTQQDDFAISILDEYQPGAEGMLKLHNATKTLRNVVVDSLNCLHLPILNILNGEQGFEDHALICKRAKGYIGYRLLTSAQYLPQEKASDFLKYYQMDQQSLTLLQGLTLNQLSVINVDK